MGNPWLERLKEYKCKNPNTPENQPDEPDKNKKKTKKKKLTPEEEYELTLELADK